MCQKQGLYCIQHSDGNRRPLLGGKSLTDKLHNAESAAALLGVRPSTIRWWWTIGKLNRVKIGRLTRVRESELLALIKN